MANNNSDFVTKIMTVVVSAVVVIAVAIPILTDTNLVGSIEGPSAVILGILPVFMVLSILMIVIKLFMGKKN